jgi:serine/threonine-protein kinase
LFSGDVAMVADFGVAKAISVATSDADRPEGSRPRDLSIPVTSLGTALGTPAYMSPEQATADPTTDHRADVYAFGVVAYEMLTGLPPFTGRSASQLLAAQVTEPPEPISRKRPNIPPALAALVMRCLEKRPSDRPQTAAEIVHALDDITTPSGGLAPTSATLRALSATSEADLARGLWGRRGVQAGVIVGIVVLASAALGLTFWKRGSTEASATTVVAAADPGPSRIAVLPFENLGDSSEAYFADGITDAVRGKLTGLSGMQVIARASSNQYRATKKSPAEIARELGVRYLLTGTVRWAKSASGPSHVQVSPELVEISSDGAASSKWQQPFNAEMADVFRVQSDIAGKVAEAMSVAVGGADKARLTEVPTRNSAAYDAYLRAEALYWQGATGPVHLRRAIGEYSEAVRLDSTFALAWAGVARASSLLYSNGVPTAELARQARDAANRALRLAPTAAFAHSAAASRLLNVDNRPTEALAEIETARTLTPNDPEVISRLAGIQSALGRFDDALRMAREAQQLDPRSIAPLVRLQTALAFLRRYPEAREVGDQLLALAPNTSSIHYRVMVSLGEGDFAAARRVINDGLKRVNPDELYVYLAAYYDLGWALNDVEQQRLLVLGPELYDNDRASWAIVRAQVYGWRGDSALARAWGDSAAREFAIQSRDVPNDPQRHILQGLALAYAGRRSEALAEAKRGLTLTEGVDYTNATYFRHQVARIHLLLGEQDKALDILEPLLANPYYLSAGWLRIDPTFKPLKGNPRFEKLISG